MKFSQPVCEAILKDIENEVPYELACESNGVSYESFRQWLINGKNELESGKNGYYAQFLEAVRNIQKNRVIRHLSQVKDNERGHKGAEWVLERAYWKYFSPKVGELELIERVEKLEQKKAKENDSEENKE